MLKLGKVNRHASRDPSKKDAKSAPPPARASQMALELSTTRLQAQYCVSSIERANLVLGAQA
jgi:hypothetical protein